MPTYSNLHKVIEQVLKDHCTEMDDHSSPNCRKCKEMLNQLMQKIIEWSNS